jgi:hypothetical protein
MPLFKSKKQSQQSARPRNKAAEHNARARASAPSATQSVPKSSESKSAATSPGNVTVPDKRLEKILKSKQSAPLPAPTTSTPPRHAQVGDQFDWKIRRPNFRKSLKAAKNLYKILSVAVDIGMLLLVLILAISLKNLRDTVNGVISDLYKSFQLMDDAAISTTVQIPSIPIDFNLPVVQKETNVTLTQDVVIRSAHVTINSGAFFINEAPAVVTLPAGTVLPVSLSMDVPVKTEVVVDSVAVDFALADANPDPPKVGLHAAFVDLQNALGPYYCLLQRDLIDLDCRNGIYLFKKP